MPLKKWWLAFGIAVFFGSCGKGLYSWVYKAPKTKTAEDAPELSFGYDPTCAKTPGDPWEPAIRLRKEGFPCLDSQRFRPAVDVTHDPLVTERYGKAPAGIKRVANFGHNKQFWIAEIPAQHVGAMSFQLVWFKAPAELPAAHAQIVAEFKEGTAVRLLPQIPDQARMGQNPPQAVESLAMSVTGAAEDGHSCTLVAGQLGHYVISFGMSSATQRYSEIKESPQTKEVDSFPLGASGTQLFASTIGEYIDRASANFHDMRAMVDDTEFASMPSEGARTQALNAQRAALFEKATYRTFGRNCATSLIDLLDATKDQNTRRGLEALVDEGLHKLAFYPPAAVFLLHWGHMLRLGNRTRLNLDETRLLVPPASDPL